MKKTLSIALLFAASAALYAQNGAKDKPVKKATVPQVAVRWGSADTTASKSVKAKDFWKLMEARIVPVESGWKVQGFDFVYLEKRIYEDSVGNPLLVTEYLSEYCPGDTLSQGIRSLLPERVKSDDTAFITNIRLQDAGGRPGGGKKQRFIIVR